MPLPSLNEYPGLVEDCLALKEPEEKTARYRRWILSDLYFLLRYGLHRYDLEHQWLFDRCREVQDNPNGYLDLWAREHYKSTIITYGLTILDMLRNPEITIGIFSHTRPIAKSFLRQIKHEFEGNEFLKTLFPDILWERPAKDAPKWSEDDGLIIKRMSNPKEATVEAHGLVDGMPTSKHYKLMIYDDVVTKASVTTPEMIRQTTEAWELSRSLGSIGGVVRYIGTRYHFNDSYSEMMRRGAVKVRLHAATEGGKWPGKAVFMTDELLVEKRKEQGPYTFPCQMLLNPVADEAQGFKNDWLQYYERDVTGAGMNIYIVVDPANEKKTDSDYTACFVIGLGADGNYYILDMLRDRLNLTERAKLLFDLHRKWKPLAVGYEKYGMQADAQHFREKMGRENYHFQITDLGGKLGKPDRIRRLIPLFEQGKVWMPQSCFKTDYEKKTWDLVSVFVEEEYKAFPVPRHDDMLDALSRICDEDLSVMFPGGSNQRKKEPRYKYSPSRPGTGRTWMSR
jgi:predicted phage terminase large subunit-like protein